MHSRHLVKLLGLTMLAAASLIAVSASAAQAKWLLLLNGVSVLLLNINLQALKGYLKLPNDLKIECQLGLGIAHVLLSSDHKKLTGVLEKFNLHECVWVGAEKTCTINDGGAGLIKVKGEGIGVMPDASTYIVDAESTEFTTILTEGVFCTISEEAVISGKAHLLVENALEDTKVKLGKLLNLSLRFENTPVSELTGEVHISDADNANASIGVHLVEL